MSLHHLAAPDVIACVLAVILIAFLFPLAVHGLLDRWGDRHTRTRMALMSATASLPLVLALLLVAG